MGSAFWMELSEVLLNKPCRVVELNCDESILRRFLDIGMIPGAKIEKVLVSPFGGISAYFIMGSLIAIRDSDTKGVKVCYD